jgi:hypothetical protein
MQTKELKGQLSKEEFDKLQEQYKTIVEVKTDYGVAYFRKPSRLDLKAATDAVQQGISEYNEVLMENCCIAGDKAILEDADYYNELNQVINDLAKGKKLEVVKH